MGEIIRRKVMRGAAAAAETCAGADGGWRLAFARAAREVTGLLVEFGRVSTARCGLAELLEILPERGLISLLDGPQGALGALVLSPDISAALVEIQTIGHVLPQAPPPRRATRTDGAMVAGVIDRAMAELDAALLEEADFVWAGGFHYASFLEDPRPLAHLLDEPSYRLLRAEVTLGGVGRRGDLVLLLPFEGRGQLPQPLEAHVPAHPHEGPLFTEALGEMVMATQVRLEAVLARETLALRDLIALDVGQMLVLTKASLEHITLEGLDGRAVGAARLGQNRGLRALRLGVLQAGGEPVAGASQDDANLGEPAVTEAETDPEAGRKPRYLASG